MNKSEQIQNTITKNKEIMTKTEDKHKIHIKQSRNKQDKYAETINNLRQQKEETQ